MKSEKLVSKKNVLINTLTVKVCIVISVFNSCNPSSEDILKKYEEHPVVFSFQNKLGINIYIENVETTTQNIIDKDGILIPFGNTYQYLDNIDNRGEIKQNLENILSDRITGTMRKSGANYRFSATEK
jgi:hypothetical protein